MKMLDFDWSVCVVKNSIDLCLHCSVVRFKRSKNDDSRASFDKFSELAFSFSLYKPFHQNYYFEEMKLTWNMCYETVQKERTFHQVNHGSHLSTCIRLPFKKTNIKLNFKLMNNIKSRLKHEDYRKLQNKTSS